MSTPISETDSSPEPRSVGRARPWSELLGVRNISAVYVWIGLFVLFALWVPDTFLTEATLKSVLGQNSTTTLVALALVVPLSAGAFDLSVGHVLGASSVTIAWAITEGWVWPLAVLAGIAVGLCAGIFSGVAVRLRVNSFIATLAMSSILGAYVIWRSGRAQIPIRNEQFRDLFLKETFWFPRSIILVLVVAVVMWYFMEKRPVGRAVYATGGNVEAARLAGVRTDLVIFSSLALAAALAAFAGVVNAGRSGVGSPSVGPTFLIPAFAAAFLGSTQLRRGRFNVWGTVIAVFVLATGVKGLQLAGAEAWVTDLFNGMALLTAVGVSKWESGTIRWRRGSTAAESLSENEFTEGSGSR